MPVLLKKYELEDYSTYIHCKFQYQENITHGSP
ncbi:MAG: hypothetical protein ACJAUD_000297 [Crocinitomicaceae bacterium]|jgi:hypothetical protein